MSSISVSSVNVSARHPRSLMMISLLKSFGCAFALLCVSTLVGCASTVSGSRIDDAEIALVTAHTLRADEYAPYEYYKAIFLLYKAREEWGRSEFHYAKELADKARIAADTAAIKAKEDPWNGSPVDPQKTPESMKDDGQYNHMHGVEK